jgi:hypothetical protein
MRRSRLLLLTQRGGGTLVLIPRRGERSALIRELRTPLAPLRSTVLLRDVVVDGPDLWARRGWGADRFEGGQEALGDELLRLRLGLPDLDYPPAAVRARAGGVEDAAGRLLQAEPLADPS